ncbi:MAG: hypothetical protein JW724_04870 [Candidatus Altiarchaeota archaeon]|nr:hypothetical protein [Candidatus Altiarchaeota archaeon]
MRKGADLFDLSVSGAGRNSGLLVSEPSYKELVTFSQNKKEPVYNWFYYKEGFSRDLVWKLLDRFTPPEGSVVLDPFCGTGTTLLAAKQKGFDSAGFDILPLGVFVSNTKLQDGYDLRLLKEKLRELTAAKFGPASLKWTDPGFIDLRKAFSRYARNDILYFKEKILEVEDEKTRNFLFLGLLSIVSEASNTKKDGGVIKLVKKRHLPPVRYLLKNRLKRMYKDVKDMHAVKARGVARIGDARDLRLDAGSVGSCITSPPYLNYVDYTKLYGLELSLLLDNPPQMKDLRKRSLRSHVGAEYKKSAGSNSEKLKETLEGLRKITLSGARFPQVLTGYFEDMYLSIEEAYRVLEPGGRAAYVVANTCLPDLTIDVDLILAELGVHAGFTPEEILVANARWCDVAGIRKERPVRESIVIMRKD